MSNPLALASLLLTAAGLSAAVDFDREIRPLLQERCVECHGTKKVKANLRLDAKTHALKGGESGPAFVAGDPAKSLLYDRITTQDEETKMPPKGKPLTTAQTEKIRQWIAEGAVWPENADDQAARRDPRLDHWSVQPVRADFGSAKSIDDFVVARLKQSGLRMSPEADRRTLIRRLSFDLHGLPPSPERVEAFVRDGSPEAYLKLVDELLASPRYGERWARHWLDIAHYADTHGFERDQLRPNAWRYRDYVIASLNADKPYDRFIREQIAGDVVAPADPEAIVATGFLAAGPWDFVGQVETQSALLKRAARAGDLDDMVTQVMTSTMAVTMNCARCHDHKLDPIAQKEYYGLWAVFAGVKREDRHIDPQAKAAYDKERERLNGQLASLRTEIARLSGEGFPLASLLPPDSGIDRRNGTVTKAKQAYFNDLRVDTFQKVEKVPGVLGVFLPAGKTDIKVDEKTLLKGLPKTNGHAWDAIANRPLSAQRSTKLNGVDYATKGRTMLALHANGGITFDLPKLRELSGLRSTRLTGVIGFGADATAASTRADFTVYIDDQVKFQKLHLRKDQTAALDVEIPLTAKTLTLVATDGGDGISSDLLFIGDPKLEPTADEAKLAKADAARLQSLRGQTKEIETSLGKLTEPAKVYAAVPQKEVPVIKLNRRGNPEDTGEEVTPSGFAWVRHAPASFGGNDRPEGERRQALAEWIIHPENPLTRRTMVNRLWHHHFGQGIVTTPSDFGLGGDRPSHPELLDWLATEFQRNGWRLKPLHRLIVTSAAYRQSALTVDAKAAGIDSTNRLLWRQNPRRLDAESLRDAVLATSGKLDLTAGGPGFKDFDYVEAYAPIYNYVSPDKPELWRRSVYRFVVRTTPHTFLAALDCADPANLTPARNRTTTAIQALALSNNEFMLRQSRHLATRVENEGGPGAAGVDRAFALTFQRAPTATERRAAVNLVNEQGLFALCRALLNANEFTYLD
jgi:mono/diheme cytochrome c family protein